MDPMLCGFAARSPALAHSLDNFIREQIPNVLWKGNANQLPPPG